MRGHENNLEEREAGEIPFVRQTIGGRNHPPRDSFNRGGRGFRGGTRVGRLGHDIGPRGYGARGHRSDASLFRGGRTGERRPPISRGGRIEDGRGRGRGHDGRGRIDARGGRINRHDELRRPRASDGPRSSFGFDDHNLDNRFHRNHRDDGRPGNHDHESVSRQAPLQAFPQRPRAPSNGSEGEILSESELTPPPRRDGIDYSIGPPPNSIHIDQRPHSDDLNQRWNYDSRETPSGRFDNGYVMDHQYQRESRSSFQANQGKPAKDELWRGTRPGGQSEGMNNSPGSSLNRDDSREPRGTTNHRPIRFPLELPTTSRDRSMSHHQHPPMPQHEPGQIVDDPSHTIPSGPSPYAQQKHTNQSMSSPQQIDQRGIFPRGGRGVRMHVTGGRGREGREHDLPLARQKQGKASDTWVEDRRHVPGRSFGGRGVRGGHRAPGPQRSFEGRGRPVPISRGIEANGSINGRGFEVRGRDTRMNASGSDHEHRGMGRGHAGRGRFDPGGGFSGLVTEHDRSSYRSLEGRGGRGRGSIEGGRGYSGHDTESFRNDRQWNRDGRFRSISPQSSSHEPHLQYTHHEPRQDDARKEEYHPAPIEQPTITRSFASFAVENDLIQLKAATPSVVTEGLIASELSSPIPDSSSSYIMDAKGLAGEKFIEALGKKPKEPPKTKSPPPTPPPEPSAPSAYITALTRLAEVEAQMEFEFAKLSRISMKRQIAQAERDALSNLPAGREAFQQDLDKFLEEQGANDVDEGKTKEVLPVDLGGE